MSHIDVSGALAKIAALRANVPSAIEEYIDAEVAVCQARAVELAPQRTGNLAQVIGRPEAIGKTDEGDGKIVWRFGFITEAMQKAAWYWHFVEYGTKGYQAGDQRSAGVDKHGRQRRQKVKRHIPTRIAHPFLRPAIIEMQRRLERSGWWAKIVEKAVRE